MTVDGPSESRREDERLEERRLEIRRDERARDVTRRRKPGAAPLASSFMDLLRPPTPAPRPRPDDADPSGATPPNATPPNATTPKSQPDRSRSSRTAADDPSDPSKASDESLPSAQGEQDHRSAEEGVRTVTDRSEPTGQQSAIASSMPIGRAPDAPVVASRLVRVIVERGDAEANVHIEASGVDFRVSKNVNGRVLVRIRAGRESFDRSRFEGDLRDELQEQGLEDVVVEWLDD